MKKFTFDIHSIAGTILQTSPTTSYQVATKEIRLGFDLLEMVGSSAARLFRPGHVLVVGDPNTYPIAGVQSYRSLQQAGFSVHSIILQPENGPRLEADEATLRTVQTAVEQMPEPQSGLVAIGAGTINDLTKLTAFRCSIPYGVVATAASMNGYTSAIAAILAGGVKRTVPCAPPLFVIADLDVVATAPVELARSGLGDLLSKPVSSADWRLAHFLFDEPFLMLPVQMVEQAFERTRQAAVQIGNGSPKGLEPLMEALLLSGISMASAGSSSPASGGEHLLSHLWDMTAPYRGRDIGLHGAQVGVATLITSTLYTLMRQQRPQLERREQRLQAYSSADQYLEHRLKSLPVELRPAVAKESRSKYPTFDILKLRLENLDTRWAELWNDLTPFLLPPETIRQVLEEAGAATTARAIGVPAVEVREAYRMARDIRNRYSVLDLAFDLGVLDELEDTVIDRSGVLT